MVPFFRDSLLSWPAVVAGLRGCSFGVPFCLAGAGAEIAISNPATCQSEDAAARAASCGIALANKK